jgi:xylan 1,4-beta-xylosidase
VKHVDLEIQGVAPDARVLISRLDEQHGNTQAAYVRMGKPRYPTQTQIEQLNQASELGVPETQTLSQGTLSFDIPVNGLVLLEVQK